MAEDRHAYRSIRQQTLSRDIFRRGADRKDKERKKMEQTMGISRFRWWSWFFAITHGYSWFHSSKILVQHSLKSSLASSKKFNRNLWFIPYVLDKNEPMTSIMDEFKITLCYSHTLYIYVGRAYNDGQMSAHTTCHVCKNLL